MSTRIFVSCDSAAVAAGANEVAAALQAECAKRGLEIELVRNSSRGMFWLEPLVEVGSSRVDLQACKLEYSIVSPK